MQFDVESFGGAVIWLVMLVLMAFAFYRAKTRRRHIGSGAAGAVYGMMNDDKRKAIEIVVADKAAARDFEHADDDGPTGQQANGRTDKGRVR
jgi:uncharacterized membrane protein